MAENVTVDTLSTNISVQAEGAAGSITALATALQGLAGVLGPITGQMALLAKATRGLNTAALSAAGKTAKLAPTTAMPSSIQRIDNAFPVIPVADIQTQSTAAVTAMDKARRAIAAPLVPPSVNRVTDAFSVIPGTIQATIVEPIKDIAPAIRDTADVTTRGFGKIRTVTAGIGPAFTGISQRLKTMGEVGKHATSGLFSSFIQLRSVIFFTLFTLGALVGMFKLFVGQAMSVVERANLFSVAMGDLRDQANAYGDAVSNALGIDPVGFKETLSTFQLMTSSLGIGADAAYKMSQNFTQLTYDYASLFEMDFETVEAKFRSAIAGQTRAIAAFGLDVTLASLKVEALREGIEGNVATFTKANKIILMHNLVLRNSIAAQGDLARTISSPANMLRVLKDQFTVAARSIGYIFIPMLKAVLPWLIALAQAINMAASAFLGLFGMSLPSWKDMTTDIGGAAGGADDLFNGMEDAAGATGKAADAAKKLRDYVLGIDELNILSPETPTSSGGGGGGGGGAGGGGNIKPFDVYDFGLVDALDKLIGPVKEAFARVTKGLAPFSTALKDTWNAFKPFAKNIWVGFTKFWKEVLLPLGAWTLNTVGVFVLERIKDVLEWFDKHPKAAEGVGAAIAAFTALKGLDFAIGVVGKLVGLFAGLFSLKIFGGAITAIQTFVLIITGLFNNSIPVALGTGGRAILSWVLAIKGVFVGMATPLGIVSVIILGIIAQFALLKYNWRTFTEGLADFIARTDGLRDAVLPVWETIKSKTAAVWDAIQSKSKVVWDWLTAYFRTVWGVIKVVILVPVALIWATIVAAWNAIKKATVDAWTGVYNGLKGPLNDMWNAIKPTFDKIAKTVRSVWDGLGDGLSSVWSGIKATFKSGVNAIIDILNRGPIRMLNTILQAAKKVPGASDVLKGVGLIPSIPHVAQGGQIPSGSLFVAGEAGPELTGTYRGNPNTVMPLANSGFVEAMGRAVYSAMVSAMGTSDSGESGDVYLSGELVGEVLRKTERRRGPSLVKVNG